MNSHRPDKPATPTKKSSSKSARNTRTLKRIAKAFTPYKVQVLLVFIAILLASLINLGNPLIIRLIFDEAIAKHNLPRLILFVSLLVALPALAGVIGVGQAYLSNMVGQRVMRDFRNGLYSHLQKMSLRFFTSTQTGEIQSRVTNDVGGIQTVITDTTTRVVSTVSIIIGTVIAMLFISPLLTLFSLCILPPFVWVTYKVGQAGRSLQRETQESLASLTALMQETLSVSGMLLIKTFSRQSYAQERFEKQNEKLTDLEIRVQVLLSVFLMCVTVVFSITPAVIYLVAGWQIIDNQQQPGITIGGIVAFTALQSSLLPAIGQLLSVQVRIQGALALFERIFEYLDLPIEIQDQKNALSLKVEDVLGEVVFKDVSFSYKAETPTVANTLLARLDEQQNGQKALSSTRAVLAAPEIHPRLTLNHISFSIRPGQLIALVGPSGAGKTTITYLLTRLYDVDDGAIEIDGHNIKDISLQSLGNLIGIVTQETYLFHATIKENLLYARPDATEEEITAAARAAAIHERIMELEQGYDTVVGERGYKLSGGEKQRVAIARVILKNPRFLILDEATSSLDSRSERLIQTSLIPLMKNRTTIAIAHRLSTILTADTILVMDKGEIVERGTHQDLYKQGGLYTKLYDQQFSQELTGESTV